MSVNEYATGHIPTALPFYPELNDGEFEQFCTDLLNFHPVIHCLRSGQVVERRIVSATKLLSGTPQLGADIRAEAQEGEVWVFQCKRVKQFGPEDVTAAIKDAEEGWPHADQYVLVTTCGLSTKAQSQIHQRPKWMWWDSSRLTTETQRLQPVENGINLVARYQHRFGKEWVKKLFVWGDKPFLTWQDFFAEDLSPDRQHFHHRTAFLPMANVQARLEAFAREGTGRALIFSGAGGQGKSRLLLELARQLEQQPQPIRVRFLNLSSSGLSEEQADLLTRDGDFVLIMDDAHRLDAALGDVARAASKSKSLRLIIATRPQAVEAIRNQLYLNGYADRFDEPLRLPAWNPEEMHDLAERVLDPAQRLHAPRLAGLADRCPLLVVLGGGLINAGQMPEAVTDEGDFRERVFKGFKGDFLRLQLESKRERLDRLMRFLSFVSPAPKNELLLKNAAEILGCSPLDVAEDLELFKAARLLVENREGVRLYPDLFADAVFLDACLDQGGQTSHFYKTVLANLPVGDFPSLMRNLAQADWEARVRKGVKHSLFDPVWKEFVRRFQEGTWVPHGWADYHKRVLTPYTTEGPKTRPSDRAELLGQWTSFAVFLPERTLELAEMAFQSVKDATDQDRSSEASKNARASVCGALPPLLKPIAVWHHNLAGQALDLLWSLDADEPKGDWQNSSNAIATIADVVSFEVHKPIAVSTRVLDWFEPKTKEPTTINRLRRHPWILSALLKPYFGRDVEHTWSTGRTLHISQLLVSVEPTRPLRRRALAIADRFLNSQETALAFAAMPVIKEAIQPVWGKFGSDPSKINNEAWRPDRLEVLMVIEKALQTHRDAAVILLQLRRILWNCCDHDPDSIFRDECKRVRAQMPDMFELRVARVLTSYAHDEIGVKSGPDFNVDFKAAEKQWAEFCRSVAKEVVLRYKTAGELCEFVRCQVLQLTATNSSVLAGGLFDAVAEISPDWCTALLEELLYGQDTSLDGFLWPVIHRAITQTPEAYRKAVEWLPPHGCPERLRVLIDLIGWKHLHGGGISQIERGCIMQSTRRTEEPVVCALASVAGLHFGNEPQWAIEVLSQLKAIGKRSGSEIVQALGLLVEKHASVLEPAKVGQCLANVDGFCFSETTTYEHNLAKVAEAFPKQVYEHIRSLHERAEADPSTRQPRQHAKSIPLGPIGDAVYVDREIGALWEKLVSAEPESFGQRFRLALIRSLLWADAATAPERLQRFVAGCKNGEELKLVTKLAAIQGSRFVFNFPDIVRLLLNRSNELAVVEKVRELLWLSACGGGRSWMNHQLDPEYRYILEQADALANRYGDDALLGVFYRGIAESERRQEEWHRQAFREEDELE